MGRTEIPKFQLTLYEFGRAAVRLGLARGGNPHGGSDMLRTDIRLGLRHAQAQLMHAQAQLRHARMHCLRLRLRQLNSGSALDHIGSYCITILRLRHARAQLMHAQAGAQACSGSALDDA